MRRPCASGDRVAVVNRLQYAGERRTIALMLTTPWHNIRDSKRKAEDGRREAVESAKSLVGILFGIVLFIFPSAFFIWLASRLFGH